MINGSMGSDSIDFDALAVITRLTISTSGFGRQPSIELLLYSTLESIITQGPGFVSR
jgi:hypothetical protein